MPSPLRARLRRAVLGKTDAKIARQQRQLDAQAKQLTTSQRQQAGQYDALVATTDKILATEASLKKTVDRLALQIAELGRRADALTASTAPVASLADRANKADAAMKARDVEFEIRRSQVGALETRLARVEERTAESRTGVLAPGESVEAADLLAEIRREHEQIRVRMQVITLYEERLRRVEESLLSLYDGDHRHRL